MFKYSKLDDDNIRKIYIGLNKFYIKKKFIISFRILNGGWVFKADIIFNQISIYSNKKSSISFYIFSQIWVRYKQRKGKN